MIHNGKEQLADLKELCWRETQISLGLLKEIFELIFVFNLVIISYDMLVIIPLRD